MYKFLMILVLATLSTEAAAEWTMIQTNDNGNMYIDFDSVQKSGDLITVSTLNDYYSPQQKRELSSQWSELHDCKNKKFKALAINYYAENMGQGALVEAFKLNAAETAWSDVVQYSVGELKANVICSR
ncbi:MAG: surface-adhesin E family protein [Pseudomonadota bacterium]